MLQGAEYMLDQAPSTHAEFQLQKSYPPEGFVIAALHDSSYVTLRRPLIRSLFVRFQPLVDR